MTTSRVFVSHSHVDNEYCRAFVAALREALANVDAVWYDEHNLGWGALQQVIDRELLQRQHFIAILSPTAVSSDWVKTEIYAALGLLRNGKMLTFQLVVAQPCDVQAVSPILGTYKRIENAGGQPFPPEAAAMHAQRVIAGLPADPPNSPPRETLPPLGPAPVPAKSIPAHHLTSKPYYDLGYRGYAIAGLECILPPVCPVPGGVFTMGSDQSQDTQARNDELPQHECFVGSFAMSRHPVTVAEYRLAVQAGAMQEPPKSYGLDWQKQQTHSDHPVVCVSWKDSLAYSIWLAKLTNQPWHLPTEAEWEKAARGTDGSMYPWNAPFEKSRCNTTESGIGTTTSVGSYPEGESPSHVQDMAGNVWEWTHSKHSQYPYVENDGREKELVEGWGSDRVLRGGSWKFTGRIARTAYRNHAGPHSFNGSRGFRLAFGSVGS